MKHVSGRQKNILIDCCNKLNGKTPGKKSEGLKATFSEELPLCCVVFISAAIPATLAYIECACNKKKLFTYFPYSQMTYFNTE